MPPLRSACLPLLFLCSGLRAAPPTGELRSEFIFGQAPFAECHASTLVETPKGLVAAWFGGTRERSPDVVIWVSRREAGGWTAPVEVANGLQFTYTDGTSLRYACWNPVLFQPPGGPLLLFYKVGTTAQNWWGMVVSSRDQGVTWTEPRRLPPGCFGPIKNKPVSLPGGVLLAPSSDESHETPSSWRVHFERSTDGGRSWTRTGPLNDGHTLSAIQPSILVHPDGRLQALGRTRQGRIFDVWSSDGGLNWGPMTLSELPNPNSGTDAVTLRDGRHLLVYNHTPSGRSPLNVAISRDGRAWEGALVLESEPGEFSYPAVIQASDGLVHLTYTWKRKRIRHVVLDPARLQGMPIEAGRWPAAVGAAAP